MMSGIWGGGAPGAECMSVVRAGVAVRVGVGHGADGASGNGGQWSVSTMTAAPVMV
jgi:hypothetical protein